MTTNTQSFVLAKPGVQISVFDFGGRGPPLLLCHANGFHALCYQELAKHLSNQFHCFALDFRGSGDSPISVSEEAIHMAVTQRQTMLEEWMASSQDIPTIEGYAEDICSVANHFEWQDFFLFGHSSGGCAVMAAIPKLGSRVRAAFIYEPVTVHPEKLRETGVIAPVTEKLWRGALKRRHIFASKDEAFTAYGSRAFKHFDKTVLRAYVNHGFKVTPCGRSVELKCSRQCEALVFALVERMAAGYFDALADIRCPVVVGAGAGTFGGAGMADRSEKVAAQLGNGRLERMSLSHFAPFEDPKGFGERLTRCLLPTSKL